MFSRAKSTSRTVIAADSKAAPPSIISSDMKVTGDIISEGEVQIDGAVKGDVRCKALTIGVTGSIQGEVQVERARIHGVMNGQLQASSVFLASTARMVGDVIHESLAVEPGAFVDGHCHHVEQKKAEEPLKNLMLADDHSKLGLKPVSDHSQEKKADRSPQYAIKDVLPESAARAS
ncbi:MAG: hypothetical protein A2516_10375 [Alphaproteobacteria bacterium RIFOXYD12_FULL_60_8]|nr:MAG: hypothetical protein A2516_10375 [Alphaproteobacteria bacterium RIFOXYD12_FULL_60_8]